MVFFPGDDLSSVLRPRGLPIGNLTSQFWSNCYLDPLDHFIKCELHCPAYLRCVDDLALFSDSKRELWRWKTAIVDRLQTLRLTVHDGAQVVPVTHGIPWLGFAVYPDHRRLKARKVREADRRRRWQTYQAGEIRFRELHASVQAWVAHASHGNTWGLRRHVLERVRPFEKKGAVQRAGNAS
jgi:hypothetical protein